MDKLMFLNPKHPSAKTPAAAFLFQTSDGLLFVEANTNLAVQAMELLCDEDNCPADGFELLGVFRDYGTIGIRSNDLVGISYVEFLARIVDKEKLANIPMLKECIAASLTPEDRKQMVSIIQSMKSSDEEESEDEDENEEDDEPDEDVEIVDTRSQNTEKEKTKLINALTGLGFQKKPVNTFIATITDEIGSTPIEKLIRKGIQNLSS